MAICGRCDKPCLPNVDSYSCGSTGNMNKPEEILWYHKICPERRPFERCELGGHDKYYGSCACPEYDPPTCPQCLYCTRCEQHVGTALRIRASFFGVGRALTGGNNDQA